MKKVSQKPMKRKRDGESLSILQKSGKRSSDSDIRIIVDTKMKNDAQDVVIRESSRKLRAEIMELESEMMNVQTMGYYDQIVSDIYEKMQFLDELKKAITNFFPSVVTSMKEKLTTIDELRNKINYDLENQASFKREVELHNRNLSKVNNDIDFVLIEEKGKLAIRLSKLEKALEEKHDQIKLKKREVANLSTLKSRFEEITLSLNENVENYRKIKDQKESMKAQQENSNIALAIIIEANKKLNNEYNEVEAKTNEFKKLCERIQEANKNIWNEEELEQSKLEFNQKVSSLLTDEKEIVAKVADLQITVDKRNSQYNELKRLQSQINEKEQHHAQVESKLRQTMKDADDEDCVSDILTTATVEVDSTIGNLNSVSTFNNQP